MKEIAENLQEYRESLTNVNCTSYLALERICKYLIRAREICYVKKILFHVSMLPDVWEGRMTRISSPGNNR